MTIYKLGDLLNISSGSTPRKEKSLWKDEILWYTPIDLREKTHTIRKISKVNNKKWIPKNTVLISSRAPIGYVGIAKNTCWHSQGIKGFLNNEKSIINKYLYYWVISNRGTFISKGIGATFKEISSSIIKSIRGFFPSLKIQKQIIGIIEPKEKLFLKYSNCVRIDNFENTKKDLKALIGIIEPIEKAILKIENAKKIINLMENFLYQKVTKKTSKRKISEIIVEKSKAINSNLTRVVSVGYKGFKEKFGKVSPKSKPLNQWEFVIGLISKDIPKAFNIQKETLGVSTAYKTFSSVDQNVLKIWFIFKKIDVEWQKYLKPVSRQGQGFDSKAFLMADIEMPSNNIFIGNDHLIKKILGIKNNLAILTKKFTTLREDLVYSLIR